MDRLPPCLPALYHFQAIPKLGLPPKGSRPQFGKAWKRCWLCRAGTLRTVSQDWRPGRS